MPTGNKNNKLEDEESENEGAKKGERNRRYNHRERKKK